MAGGIPPPGVPQGRSLAWVSPFLSKAGEVLGWVQTYGQVNARQGRRSRSSKRKTRCLRKQQVIKPLRNRAAKCYVGMARGWEASWAGRA